MVIIGLLIDFEQKQHMKYKEPVKGKGIRRIFRDNGYKLYLVDEFRTSCMCSICKEETGRCEKFQIRKNPKPYKSGNILVHGLKHNIALVILCFKYFLIIKSPYKTICRF